MSAARARSADRDVPVLVVGAGPTGCVLALELARHGVPTLVVERTLAAPVFPKMDYLNGRSMELLRRLGLADRIRELGVDPAHDGDVVWTRSLAEPPLSRWTQPSPARLVRAAVERDDGSAPQEVYARIQGSRLEELLRSAVRASPLVDLREGWALRGLTEDGLVEAEVEDLAAGAVTTVRAGVVVGADGASSLVRRLAGIPLDARGESGRRCSVYFRSHDRALRARDAFVTVTSRGAVLVSRDGHDLFTASFPLPEGEAALPDPVVGLRAALGLDVDVDELISVGSWRSSLAVAQVYRRGPLFLIGDAAHQFVPFGGHGANTGIGDAVDLGWKLAGRVAGWGGERLLDSYEAERRPVALLNRELSAAVLDVSRRFARLVEDGVPREQVAGFLDRHAHHSDAAGVHFGARYVGSPVVCDEPAAPPPWHWNRICATAWPGVRLPAVRLHDGSSLLDRLGPGFTLVDQTPDGRGAALLDAARRRGLPVQHLPVGGQGPRAALERDLVLVRPDQHVAWRSGAPEDWDAVLDRVAGRSR